MRVSVKVVKGGESAAQPADCRSVLVGPHINQPDPFPGYAGFVGWESPVCLRDGGQTWIAPAPDHGFLVDHTYGYGKAMELPDGSLFLTYLSTGGHRSEDARGNGIWCIRLRVRPDHSGIDLLPAPDLKP